MREGIIEQILNETSTEIVGDFSQFSINFLDPFDLNAGTFKDINIC